MNTNLKTLTVLVAGVLLLGLSGVKAYAGGLVDTTFDPGNFPDNSDEITNDYWTLLPETTFKYWTQSEDGCEVNYVWVTNDTLLIAGITTQVVQDAVYVDEDCDGIVNNNDLSENTLDWYAQDEDENVWYLGEWTEEYLCTPHSAPGCTSTEGSWQTDVHDAEPGIIMLADPMPGLFYQQEYLEDEAEDIAKVLRVNARVVLTFNNEIDPDEYDNCVKTKEWSPLEIGVVEHKYYCDGLLLLVNELHGGTVRTELVKIIDGPPEVIPPALTPSF